MEDLMVFDDGDFRFLGLGMRFEKNGRNGFSTLPIQISSTKIQNRNPIPSFEMQIFVLKYPASDFTQYFLHLSKSINRSLFAEKGFLQHFKSNVDLGRI